MDVNSPLTPLTRLLSLNTDIQQMRSQLMCQPAGAPAIAELQEGIDRCRRASLASAWLARGHSIDDADGDDPDGAAGAG